MPDELNTAKRCFWGINGQRGLRRLGLALKAISVARAKDAAESNREISGGLRRRS